LPDNRDCCLAHVDADVSLQRANTHTSPNSKFLSSDMLFPGTVVLPSSKRMRSKNGSDKFKCYNLAMSGYRK